ncbi:Planctomycete cytochrome C, partial [Durusdinium trenchii]
YDPISQRDYYRLFAIFNNTADNNDARGLAPKLSLPTPAQEAEIATLRAELASIDSERSKLEAELAPKQDSWEQAALAEKSITWETVAPVSVSGEQGTTFELLDDGSALAVGDTPNSDVYTVRWTSSGSLVTAIRLETLTHASLPKQGPGRAGNGNFVLTNVEFKVGEREEPATWLSASADHSQKGYPIRHAIDNDRATGWAINVSSGSMNVDRRATFILAEPVNAIEGTPLAVKLRHEHPGNNRYQIGRFRISVTTDDAKQIRIAPEIRELIAIEPSKRSKEQQQQIRQAFLGMHRNWSRLTAERDKIDKRLKAVQKTVPTTLIMQELPKPRESYVHVRGDFLRKGAPVEPGTPAVLPPLEQETPPNRLDFARWLVSEANPLTPRVAVNQVWMRLFGRGIVGTENDFGLQGEDPTHPLLLDWLASELVREYWSMKSLLRTIVTSSTYRQSSRERSDLDAIDPRNRLLARQNRIRLEAEIIRDVLLSASGLLSQRLHGPPVYPPQPEGIYILTQTRKSWPESKGEDRYRRGLYTYFWRSSPHPLLPTFDAPDATTTCTRRTRSNTPLQALTLSNDRGLVELAQGVARRLLSEAPQGDGPRIQHLYRLCLGRPASDAEAGRLLSFVEAQRGYFMSHPEAARTVAGIAIYSTASPVDAATWVAASRVVTNLDEFITRD